MQKRVPDLVSEAKTYLRTICPPVLTKHQR